MKVLFRFMISDVGLVMILVCLPVCVYWLLGIGVTHLSNLALLSHGECLLCLPVSLNRLTGWNDNLISYLNLFKKQFFNWITVDILATAAAFFETTVHQMSLRWTERRVEVVRTPCLSSSTCLVFFLMRIASLIHRSAAATPGGQSFRRRQQWLPKCQQLFNQKGCLTVFWWIYPTYLPSNL